MAPPWREIVHGDEGRKQSREEAVATFEAMIRTYEALDYETVPLPLAPVVERAAFIRATAESKLGGSGGSNSPQPSETNKPLRPFA